MHLLCRLIEHILFFLSTLAPRYFSPIPGSISISITHQDIISADKAIQI
jgi:hypothetical protein